MGSHRGADQRQNLRPLLGHDNLGYIGQQSTNGLATRHNTTQRYVSRHRSGACLCREATNKHAHLSRARTHCVRTKTSSATRSRPSSGSDEVRTSAGVIAGASVTNTGDCWRSTSRCFSCLDRSSIACCDAAFALAAAVSFVSASPSASWQAQQGQGHNSATHREIPRRTLEICPVLHSFSSENTGLDESHRGNQCRRRTRSRLTSRSRSAARVRSRFTSALSCSMLSNCSHATTRENSTFTREKDSTATTPHSTVPHSPARFGPDGCSPALYRARVSPPTRHRPGPDDISNKMMLLLTTD